MLWVGISKNIWDPFALRIPIGKFNICIHGSLLETHRVVDGSPLKFESILILRQRPHWLLGASPMEKVDWNYKYKY